MNVPILIVDDYTAMLRLLRRMLQDLGFRYIDQASDGRAALAKLRENPYRLIISDLNMEPMSGLELLREVRDDDRLKSLPFIMVTAAGETDQVTAAKKAGVSDYIVKPFTTETVQKKIAGALGERRELPGASWIVAK